MKTRRQTYIPKDTAKSKEKNTSAKVVKELSNSLTTKAARRPKRNTAAVEKENDNFPSKDKTKKSQIASKVADKRNNNLQNKPKQNKAVTKKCNDNSSSKVKTKKSQISLKVADKRNYSQDKSKSKQLKTNEVSEVKRATRLRQAKMPKNDVEIIEDDCITLRQGKVKRQINLAKDKQTTKTQNEECLEVIDIEDSCVFPRRRGRQPTTFAKKKATEMLSPQNMEIVDENHVTPQKGRGRVPKTVEKKKTIKKPTNIGNNSEIKDDYIIDSESCSPLTELICQKSETDNNDVQFLQKNHINIQDENDLESPNESNAETEEVLEDRDQGVIVNSDSDDDDHPDEVAFSSSKKEIVDQLKLIRHEIEKIRDGHKEKRKRIHDRNILQKKQKKDKVAEIQKRKLPPQLLEYVSKLPKTVNNFEIKQAKSEELKSMDSDEDEKDEEALAPEEDEEAKAPEEFISIHHGSTEFKPLHLKTVIKKPPSVTDNIAKFKERAFFGSRNKRESVWELKSNLIKQAVAGKL